MVGLTDFTKRFVEQSKNILEKHLVGIYLHGSAAMGCFNEQKSDIDLLVVVDEELSKEIKRRYMDMAVALNKLAPSKGIEFSIVREDVCKPFVYPTPFELHFSNMHLERYKADPLGYIDWMTGTDRDLAAHFTVTFYRGKCLYGREIKDVFEEVNREFYIDSILHDVENAEEEITGNPTYLVLNLCRVLAYLTDGLILSKLEGGKWGLAHVPEEFHRLISQALGAYRSEKQETVDISSAEKYAAYMMARIRRTVQESKESTNQNITDAGY